MRSEISMAPRSKPLTRLALAGIVAEARDHLVRRGDVGALHGAHDRFGDARAEERVFAVGFLVPAQARVADRLHDQREILVHADGAGFARHGA